MKIIKHNRFMDVAFLVHKVWNLEKKLVIKGMWLNQGFVTSYPLDITQTIKIEKTRLNEWFHSTSNQRCIRDGKWERGI